MSDWYPVSYYIQPEYTTAPVIRVADSIRPTFVPLSPQRRWWTKARNAGLAQWMPAGLAFEVRNSERQYRPDRITLAFADVPDPIQGWAAFEHPPCRERAANCGWVQLDLAYVDWLWEFRSSNRAYADGRLKYLVSHEVGHCLGFGHGGDGVMADPWRTNRVSDEEIAAAHEYWLPLDAPS